MVLQWLIKVYKDLCKEEKQNATENALDNLQVMFRFLIV